MSESRVAADALGLSGGPATQLGLGNAPGGSVIYISSFQVTNCHSDWLLRVQVPSKFRLAAFNLKFNFKLPLNFKSFRVSRRRRPARPAGRPAGRAEPWP
jgi:hypothetical protein